MTVLFAFLHHRKDLICLETHLFVATATPFVSSSSGMRTLVSSMSRTVEPLFSTSQRRKSLSPLLSAQVCLVIISTLSLIGVDDELNAGFRLPPPPPLPPLVQPIITCCWAFDVADATSLTCVGRRQDGVHHFDADLKARAGFIDVKNSVTRLGDFFALWATF